MTRHARGDVDLSGKGRSRKPGFLIWFTPELVDTITFRGRPSNPQAESYLQTIGLSTANDDSLTYIDEVLVSPRLISVGHLSLEAQFGHSPVFRHILTQWDVGPLTKLLGRERPQQVGNSAEIENLEFLGLAQLHSTRGSRLSPFINVVEVDRLYERIEPQGNFAIPVAQRKGNRVTYSAGKRGVGSRSDWTVSAKAALHADSSIVEDSCLRVYEHGADPSWDFVAGQSHQSLIGGRNQPSKAIIVRQINPEFFIDEAISLAGRASSNWYHALIEYIPRVIEADRLFPNDIPAVANDDLPAPAKELLRKLTEREIIFIKSTMSFRAPQAWCEVGRLHFRSPTLQLTDQVPRRLSDAFLEVDEVALKNFRDKVMEIFSKAPSGPSKLFLTRTGHRSLSNQNEILKVAEKFGYQPFDVSSLSLSQQIGLFMGASHVIAPGGAIAASYLFLSGQAKVIGLASRSTWDFPLGSILTSFSGSYFEQFLGRNERPLSGYPHRRDWLQGSYRINAVLFQRFLARTH